MFTYLYEEINDKKCGAFTQIYLRILLKIKFPKFNQNVSLLNGSVVNNSSSWYCNKSLMK